MPPLFHVGAAAACPHGGQVVVVATNTRVLVGGMPVATMADSVLVARCTFTVPPGAPQPCTTVRFVGPASRVTVMGQPVILQTSVGLCRSADQIPSGVATIAATQTRVVGT